MIFITHHAVQRYIERVDPGRSPRDALQFLIGLTREARRIQERTWNGQEQWVAGDVTFVCKRDPRKGLVAVTIGRYEHVSVAELEQAEFEIEHLELMLASRERELADTDAEIAELVRAGHTGGSGRCNFLKSTRIDKVRAIEGIRHQIGHHVDVLSKARRRA